MKANPHYAAAEGHLNSENMTSGTEFAKEYRELVLIEATLALAFEQRTANLIAYRSFGLQVQDMTSKYRATVDDRFLDAATEIETRLGLA